MQAHLQTTPNFESALICAISFANLVVPGMEINQNMKTFATSYRGFEGVQGLTDITVLIL